MRTIAGAVFVLAIGIVPVAAQQNAPPPPPAPAPGSPATYKSGEALAAALKIAKATAGGMTTAGISTTDQYRINIVRRSQDAGAIAHAGNTELHYILEGSATVVTGGKIVRGVTGQPATIENGVTQHVTKGDVIIVPANSPHWYSKVDGEITYLEVRWLAPK